VLSVTVRVTVKMPAAVNVCVGVTPVPAGFPSPQSHEYDAIVLDPAADDADPLKLTAVVVVVGFGEAVKLAVGSATEATASVRVTVFVNPRPSVTVSVIVKLPVLV
jgi:hypothetical protein